MFENEVGFLFSLGYELIGDSILMPPVP